MVSLNIIILLIYWQMRMNIGTIFILFTRWPPYWQNVRTVTVLATGSNLSFSKKLCVSWRETGKQVIYWLQNMSQLLPIRFQEHLQVCIFRCALLIFGDTLQKFQNTPLVLHSETGVLPWNTTDFRQSVWYLYPWTFSWTRSSRFNLIRRIAS